MSHNSVPPSRESPPILRIKKGAERDVPAYYDRLKRLSQHDASEERGAKRGGFRFFRSGRFSLLPLLILALGVVVVFRFVPTRDRSAAVVADMSLSLRAYAYKDAVLVSLSFSGKIPPNPIAVQAVCSLAGHGDPLDLSGEIGPDNHTLRGRMEGGSAGGMLTADVTVAGIHRTLHRRVQD